MQAYHYNRGGKDSSVLEEGDSVRMKPIRLGQNTWHSESAIKKTGLEVVRGGHPHWHIQTQPCAPAEE